MEFDIKMSQAARQDEKKKEEGDNLNKNENYDLLNECYI